MESPSGPDRGSGGVPLRVAVRFQTLRDSAGMADRAPLLGGENGARIEGVRARAFEVLDPDTEVLRAADSVAIGPSDSSFEIVLDVPPAESYRVAVDARGTRTTQQGESEPGILYAGDGFVAEVGAGGSDEVEITLVSIMPFLTARLDPPDGYSLHWTEVERALRYRLRATPEEGEEVGAVTADTSLSIAGSPAGRWRYRVRAELPGGWISAYSEEVEIVIPDETPPGSVGDLAVEEATLTAVRLTWTAPGDDGDLGQASFYDLRYSTSSITAENFDLATRVGVPDPGPQGTRGVFTVEGLAPDTPYSFALKVGDEGGNWSEISNVVDARTLRDTTAPGQVGNLAVEEATLTAVRLTWTAPGDDGELGQASSYDLRYSISTITAENFDLATRVEVPNPGPQGTREIFTVEGLAPDTPFSFALKVGDESGNWSEISNVVDVRTLRDTMAPGQVGDLAVEEATLTAVRLTWTATGDDGELGQASFYDLRYSTSTITAENFDLATRVEVPDPGPQGTREVLTVEGLAPDTPFSFALKVGDESGNWSEISNNAQGSTLDETPPDPVVDLEVVTTTATSATLSWTAPGDNGVAGRAARYDVRYAGSPITEETWEAATPAGDEPDPPGKPGNDESFTISGLLPDTPYYFAVKVADEVPNWSALSNSAGGSTLDPVLPGPVVDLDVETVTGTTVTLRWTATGDNGAAGRAASYDIRYAGTEITEDTWENATPATGEPDPPAEPGDEESFTVSDLVPDSLYHFAVKVADEVPNWSELSNVVSARTLGDTAAPSPVGDLAVEEALLTAVRLTWTATGDDGEIGPASFYDLRHSISAITAENFDLAMRVEVPNPGPPGTTEVFTVEGLTGDTRHYFAVKVADEVPNWSGLSNVAEATTLDGIAPGAVMDLDVETTTVSTATLTWTATGDNGGVGPAATYDLRTSTAPITEETFGLATQVAAPDPGPPGTIEVVTVEGLTGDTHYYFAVKVADEVPNWSVLSNLAEATTLDGIAPGAVMDLDVETTTVTTATLTWTATGDNGGVGSASIYDLRTSTAPITEETFELATQVAAPDPGPPGSTEVVTVEGLTGDTHYYFAVKVADEVPNWSVLSNLAEATTLDGIAPGAVMDLEVETTTVTTATLTWTATGDDGATGRAAVYDVRYATSAITEGTWEAATPATDEPDPPGEPGDGESFTIAGLAPDTLYYFAVKVADEVPNWSGLSNVAQGTTLPAAPPPLLTFNATGWDQHVLLHWRLPNGPRVRGVRIRFSTAGYPQGPGSGDPVPNGSDGEFDGAPGDSASFSHTGLGNGTTYYYTAFVYNDQGTFSEPRNDQATPRPDVSICWSEPPDPDGIIYSSEVIQSFEWVTLHANDFILDQDLTITKVRWWGGYFNLDSLCTPEMTPPGFRLQFYRLQNCQLPPESWIPDVDIFIPGSAGETFVGCQEDGWPVYRYEVDVQLPLLGGVRYWFVVQMGDHPFPPQWGRLAATGVTDCESMQWNDGWAVLSQVDASQEFECAAPPGRR